MTESEPTRLSHRILSSESPGLHLHLRESLPAGRALAACRGTVLFVHGSTLSGSMWDLRAPGYSWMDHLSRRGWACYAIDLRGYGQSDWPPGLAEPAQGAVPLVQAREALDDIRDAAAFALDRTGADSLDLIGGSWGTVTCAMFAREHPRSVRRLVLFAPVYCARNAFWRQRLADPLDPERLDPQLGAWRYSTGAALGARWDTQILVQDKNAWRDPAAMRALIEQHLAEGTEQLPSGERGVRVPNGSLSDAFECFCERPLYDAGAISQPVLVIRGADDVESTDVDASGLFRRLGAQVKRYVAIGAGSHFLFAERNAWQLHREVDAFLDDDPAAAQCC